MSVFDWLRYQFIKRGFPKTKSLGLPLPDNIELKSGTPRIAVVLHLFYTDLMSEILEYLSNIPLGFDLLISTDTVEKKMRVLAHPIVQLAEHTTIIVVPNRGRDIAPKLVTFVKEYKNYDILLFIHSKHSLFNSELAGWRKVIFSQLLGSTLLIKDILALFNTFPQLGMVSPNHFEPILFAVKWGPNWEGSNQLAKRMEIHLDQNAPLDFPSGSMFWARPKALLPLINLKLSFDEFEPENGQTDGALGHQIERLFYFCCEKAGYSWLKISLPELFKDRKKIVIVRDVKDIESLLEQKLGT